MKDRRKYNKQVRNSFCPTGPGGGVDPSCSPSVSTSSISSKQEHVMKIDSLSKDREHAMSFDAKTGELLREESGNTGADWSKGENYSVSIPRDLMASKVISHLHTHMDEYSSFSDGDWAAFASKQIKDMTVVDKFNVYTLVKPESYISAERSKYTPRELKEAWEKELYKIESADVKGVKSPGQLIDETNKNLANIYGFQYTSRPKHPTTNKHYRVKGLTSNTRKRTSPTKFDPTRTTTLRRAFVGKLRRKFARLRKAIYDLLVVEDALGLKKKNLTYNTFCPTGPGGGVDPTCSPVESTSSSFDLPKEVKENIDKHGMNGPFNIKEGGGWEKTLKSMGHSETTIAEVRQLFDFHRHGGPSQEKADLEIVRHLSEGTEIGKALRDQIRMEEGLREYWESTGRHVQKEKEKQQERSDLEYKWKNGMGNTDAYSSIEDQWEVEHAYKFKPLGDKLYYRKGGLDKDVVSTSENSSGAKSHSVSGSTSVQPHFKPTNKFTAKEMHAAGYRVLGGFGFNQMGYSGEAEVTWVKIPKLSTNERWRFNTTPEQLEAFKEWLKTQVEYYVTGMTDEELWRKFIESGFKKGAGRAFDDTKPQAGWTEAEGAFYAGTKDQFLKSAFGQPESLSKVQLLAARTFDELEGMSADMQNKLGRILVDGLTKGNGPISIAREMSNQLNLSMTRAETIARTELIRAHAEGQLVGMEELGVDEVGVMVEWSTAGDDRVCELCEPMEGVVLKIEEARGMIPRHPNCRCAFIPANVAEPTDDQKRGKRKIMSAVRTSAALGKDDFSTAVPVTKERPKSILPVITNHWWLVPSVVYQFSSLLVNTFCHTGPGGGVDPTCSPGGVPSDSSLPSLTTLSKVKDLPGSMHPVLMKDAEGKHFVVKEGKSPDHLKNENAADAIYRAAGVKVPKSAIIDGKKVSEFTNGTTTLGQYVNSGHSAIDMYKQIGQHFVMDALMANHDVIGLSADNILIKDGQAIRVDNGGAMKYRAQGGIKPSKLWGPEVVQLESMRDKNINPQSAKVFAHLTDHDIKEQIKDVVSKRETIINAAKSAGVDHEVLSKRLDYLEAKLKLPAPTMVKPATIDHSLSSPHDQVKPTAIINGQHLANMLKSKFAGHAYTPLYLKKIEALNPNGVHGGTVIIPMTSIKFTDKNSVKIAKDKQAEVVAAIKQMAPAGTIIKAKATMSAKAAGVTKTFGSGSKYEGTFTTEKAKVGAKLISESDPQYAGKFTPVVDGVAKHSPMKIYDEKAHDEWVNLITSAEKSAVASWKGSAKSIRASVSSGVLSPTAKNFMSALEKAKPHEGPLYRGISGEYADGIAKQIQEAGIGGTWSDPAPHCTSVKQSIGINFSGGKLLFRIQSLTARPIHKEDGHFTEHEVVGMPNAKYRIVGIHSNVKIMQQNSEYGNTIKHVIDLVEEHK